MAQGYQNNDQHRRYNERLAKLEERSVLALNSRKKKRQPRLKKKIPKVKHLQRRANLRRVLSIVLPFGLIMAFAIYLISPLARITTVTVSGNTHLTSKQVEAATKVKPGRLIWATLPMNKQRLARIQGRNAQIKSVQISLTGLQSVKITVKEYGIIGLIKTNGKQKLLLSNGQVQPVSGNTLDQYITYGGFATHKAMLKQTARNIAKLSPAVRNGISEVTYSPTTLDSERLKLLMNDGNTVYVKVSKLASRMSYYPSIVANTSGNRIINLEFGAYSYKYSAKDEQNN